MIKTFRFFIAIISVLFFSFAAAAQDAEALYATARKHLNQGKLDSAGIYLQKALALSPGNLSMLEDQLYLEYLRRDFAKAIDMTKMLAARPDATVKTFQLIGMTHKEIADYKEARKSYELGLSRFPNSGVLYAELGEMFANLDKKADAIRTWEKGISMDPGHSGNYYYATLHYATNGNPLWAMLYGENFVNIERLSERTTEIKTLLTNLYKKISAPGYLSGRDNPFATAIAATYYRQPPVSVSNLNVETLTGLRRSFITDWYRDHSTRFPYKLFELLDQLNREGLFEAYHQWLFGKDLNPAAFEAWIESNKEKMAAFERFSSGRVFKVPAGQNYRGE